MSLLLAPQTGDVLCNIQVLKTTDVWCPTPGVLLSSVCALHHKAAIRTNTLAYGVSAAVQHRDIQRQSVTVSQSLPGRLHYLSCG
jgi:hypothetical protein